MAAKQLGQRGFMLTVGAVVVACTFCSWLIPHSDYIRYQTFKGTIFSNLTWIYERIHHDDRPIDVVFLGSSREGRGANSPQIEEHLAQRGHPLNVVNISLPAAGWDLRLTELRELLTKHKIKLVVFGVVESLPRDGHQAFGNLSTVPEVLTAPILVNRTLPANFARLPYRQIELAVASQVPEAFGYKSVFDKSQYAGSNLDNRIIHAKDEQEKADKGTSHQDELEAESTRRKREITPPLLPQSLSFIEFGVSQHYMKELKTLSEQHNFQVAFVFLPFYKGYEKPLDLDYLERFGPVWRATFLMNDPGNYIDAAHASRKAADELSLWLADRIITQLEGHE